MCLVRLVDLLTVETQTIDSSQMDVLLSSYDGYADRPREAPCERCIVMSGLTIDHVDVTVIIQAVGYLSRGRSIAWCQARFRWPKCDLGSTTWAELSVS
jgi:hypothetical protein